MKIYSIKITEGQEIRKVHKGERVDNLVQIWDYTKDWRLWAASGRRLLSSQNGNIFQLGMEDVPIVSWRAFMHIQSCQVRPSF